MSLFRRKTETRSFMSDLVPARVAIGAFSDPVSQSSAQQVVAYSSAVNLLSTIVSSLPIEVYVGKGRTQRPARKPAWLDDPAGEGYGLEDWQHAAAHRRRGVAERRHGAGA